MGGQTLFLKTEGHSRDVRLEESGICTGMGCIRHGRLAIQDGGNGDDDVCREDVSMCKPEWFVGQIENGDVGSCLQKKKKDDSVGRTRYIDQSAWVLRSKLNWVLYFKPKQLILVSFGLCCVIRPIYSWDYW